MNSIIIVVRNTNFSITDLILSGVAIVVMNGILINWITHNFIDNVIHSIMIIVIFIRMFSSVVMY